ncbi:MAG: hypothetical protein GF411_12120 [Candidatus Lokiarchaeota archaeon]|nr:hypothetical protein [Candidatus Lokiarchaeota archaeon]
MASNWQAIAKAEFLVQTSKFRGFRKPLVGFISIFAIFWAFQIVPYIESIIILLLPGNVEGLLMIAFPGAMRSVIFLLWMMLLVYPIIYAVRNIKIGQWEIMLSNNVTTREILLGTFIGKVPSYLILTLMIAPIFLSPFILVYHVTFIGSLMIYLTIFFFAMTTLWLAVVISTAIQSKLGNSERGDDIAKAFSMIFVLLFLLPLYGLMYFAPQMAAIMGLDIFLVLPATWGADVITGLTLFFSGLPINDPLIISVSNMIQSTILPSLILFGIYFIVSVFGGVMSADRIFRLESDLTSESIVTVGKENIFIKTIRRIYPSAGGILLVTALKDFGRKAHNISRLLYGMFIAILLPFLLNMEFFSEMEFQNSIVIILAMTVNMSLAMISAITIGGVGFIESKDHLWILKSSPNGSKKFIRARSIGAIIIMIPVSLLPGIITSLLFGFSFIVSVLVCINIFVTATGGTILGIGITALNPTYENQQSSSFKLNSLMSLFLNMLGITGAIIIASYIELVYSNLALSLLVSMWALPIFGICMLWLGADKLSKRE